MNKPVHNIADLEYRLKLLQDKQLQLVDEFKTLQDELYRLKEMQPIGPVKEEKKFVEGAGMETLYKDKYVQNKTLNPGFVQQNKAKLSFGISDRKLEDFIGTNLAGKVGIILTIVGIFIGAKYAIDKELISPFARILSGYIAGAALIFTAVRLKNNYQNFSAILMGGGLAVIYFITYISYTFYNLFPQAATFFLMACITIAAVIIALWYDQKMIAIFGQVAAYAIPFLLSDGSGRIIILFSYISIINIGLMYLSFRKDWKILYRMSFFFTWIITVTWITSGEAESKNFRTGFIFLVIQFFTFYITFLSYKLLRKELYKTTEVAIVLINAILFFFIGNYLINAYFNNDRLLTTFALSNAVIHLTLGLTIYKLKIADQTVYQFLSGLALLFITIAIPIELNESWVTLLWSVEAVIVCWIGIKNNSILYLTIAVPLVIIALISLLHDWIIAYPSFGDVFYDHTSGGTPFLNLIFIFSLVVTVCFGFIHFKTYKGVLNNGSYTNRFFKQAMPLIFWSTLYLAFFNEIHFIWDGKINHGMILKDQPAMHYQQISLLVYTFLFFTALLVFNKRFIKKQTVEERLLIGGIFISILFITNGLISIGDLRHIYIEQAKMMDPSLWMLAIRYGCFVAVAIFYFSAWQAVKKIAIENSGRMFSIIFNIMLLTIICNEFIHWMDLSGYQNQYKLGLSIICGIYALVLILFGINHRKKHLRIGAIVLFTCTLIKLFVYDLVTLSTISKTIVLVLLGIILLAVSFLYNKYKAIILGEDETK